MKEKIQVLSYGQSVKTWPKSRRTFQDLWRLAKREDTGDVVGTPVLTGHSAVAAIQSLTDLDVVVVGNVHGYLTREEIEQDAKLIARAMNGHKKRPYLVILDTAQFVKQIFRQRACVDIFPDVVSAILHRADRP